MLRRMGHFQRHDSFISHPNPEKPGGLKDSG